MAEQGATRITGDPVLDAQIKTINFIYDRLFERANAPFNFHPEPRSMEEPDDSLLGIDDRHELDPAPQDFIRQEEESRP